MLYPSFVYRPCQIVLDVEILYALAGCCVEIVHWITDDIFDCNIIIFVTHFLSLGFFFQLYYFAFIFLHRKINK